MKKLILSLAAACLLSATAMMAQAPNRFSYQTVVRNSTGALLANSQVGIRISILKTNATGAVQYAERHTPTTNANGLVDLQIGGGTVISGAINTINWTNDAYFIKTEIDPTGGSAYTISGTSQILATPFALNGVLNGKLGVGAAVPAFGEVNIKASTGNSDLSLMPATGRGWNFGALEFPSDLRIASFDGGTDYRDLFTIKENGNVGIGTSSPVTTLDFKSVSIVGTSSYTGGQHDASNRGTKITFGAVAPNGFELHGMSAIVRPGTNACGNSGDLSFYTWECNTGPSREVMRINGRGNTLNVSGSWGTLSDRRVKKVDGQFTDGLSTIMKINPIKFHYNELSPFKSKEQQVGVIAQELEKVAPYMVVTSSQEGEIKDLKQVNNQAYTFLLINAVKEQQAQIEALKAENAALKAESKEAKAHLNSFQSQMDALNAKLEALVPTQTVKK